MPSWLPSIPYSVPGHGYWDPVTSTINWCEEDYYATTYIAELINTFTNLWIVYVACVGIENSLRNKHDTVFLITWIAYLLVGINSFLFHATLKYGTQLMDELAMIYMTCILFYAVFSYGYSTAGKVTLAALTTALAAFITGYYHYLGDPVFHEAAFAVLTASVVFRSIYVLEVTLRPSRRDSSKIDRSISVVEQERRDKRDLDILKLMHRITVYGMACIAIGFTIWNLDNHFCRHVKGWRRQMGLPWGVLLEGHGWWHFFSGIAGFANIMRTVYLRYCLEGRQDEVEFVWTSIFALPATERKSNLARSAADKTK